LINRPKLLLADEPTGSLDADASKNIAEMLVDPRQNIRGEKVTLIMVTHSLELAEYIGQSFDFAQDGMVSAVEPVWQLSDGVLKNRSQR
jgi:ABC-type lipoprotein export system ATPase subunit